MEAVEVVDENAVETARLQGPQHALVLRALLSAPSAHVVIDEALYNDPSLPIGKPLAVL
jgi:hypothetical protein